MKWNAGALLHWCIYVQRIIHTLANNLIFTYTQVNTHTYKDKHFSSVMCKLFFNQFIPFYLNLVLFAKVCLREGAGPRDKRI